MHAHVSFSSCDFFIGTPVTACKVPSRREELGVIRIFNFQKYGDGACEHALSIHSVEEFV
jgi:hypothetical protein